MLVPKEKKCTQKSSDDNKGNTKGKVTSHFGLIDWDFKSETSRSFVHNICWYPSRFIPIIPAQLISNLSSPGDTVLDPFSGAGTTAVEALKAGRNSVAVDLNPIACYLTRTKTELLRSQKSEPHQLTQLLNDLLTLRANRTQHTQLFEGQENVTPKSMSSYTTPNLAENEGWFHSGTLEELTFVYSQIAQLSPGVFFEIAKALFIGILMSATGHRTNRPYTYYADNVKPKGDLIYKDAFKLYCGKLERFLKEYKSTHVQVEASLDSEVYEYDTRKLDDVVNQKCELIITSPPYLGVTDYAAGFRLAYLWFDFVSNLNDLKSAEIGARYRRHGKPSNLLEKYREDLRLVLEKLLIALKPRGYLCLVLGEPRRYYSEIMKYVAELLQEVYRLELQDAFTRQISKNFFLHPRGGVPTEEILIFRRR